MLKAYVLGVIATTSLIGWAVASNTQAKADNVALERQLKDLRSETTKWKESTEQAVRTLEGRTLQTSDALHLRATTSSDTARSDDAPGGELAEQKHQKVKAFAQGFRERFDAEAPRSAPARQATLDRALQSADLAGLTWHTECRATSCRIEVELGDAEDATDQYEKIAASVPWEGQAFSKLEMKTRTGTIYLEPDEQRL
jgi:hypothetical protein